jgi:hypothetical protein
MNKDKMITRRNVLIGLASLPFYPLAKFGLKKLAEEKKVKEWGYGPLYAVSYSFKNDYTHINCRDRAVEYNTPSVFEFNLVLSFRDGRIYLCSNDYNAHKIDSRSESDMQKIGDSDPNCGDIVKISGFKFKVIALSKIKNIPNPEIIMT